MAELNARIIAKASATAGETPQAADLEVAEIAVNTADGKFFTKHTDGTVKEISGSGGGGGGAVDSVNGETGAVSLGIQDMDDFELSPGASSYEWPNRANNGDTSSSRDCPNPGDWAAWSFETETYVYLHNDSVSQLLVVGETVTLTLGTGESYTGVITSNATSQPSWVMGFPSSAELNPILQAGLGASLTVESTVLPAGTNPLADGDILQWVNADQKFKPTQLTGGGGGATSIDDLTDVSTSIDPGTATWTGSWTVWTETPSQIAPNDGDMGPASGNEIIFRNNDSLGVDRTSELSALDGNTLYWRKNSGPWQTETMTSFRIFETTTLIPKAAALSASVLAAEVGDTYELADGIGPIDHSPTDGQVLTWVDDNDQWEPATAVNSVNNQTGVASLGIQDMDDFRLNLEADFQPQTLTSSSSTSGGFRWDSPSEIYISTKDNTGADISNFPTSSSGTVYLQFQGIDYAVPFDGKYNAVGTVKRLLVAPGFDATALDPLEDPSNLGEEIKVTFSAPTETPLADGDIPMWSDGSQTFRPGQPDYISLATLKAEVAASTDFADFQSRIAAL